MEKALILLLLIAVSLTSAYGQKDSPSQKGTVNWTISLPHVNTFYFQPQGESAKASIGFMGISTGFEYYYRSNKFLGLRADGVMNFEFPVPVPYDRGGYFEPMASSYLSITDNFVFNRFSIGYGVNYSKNFWALRWGTFGDEIYRTRTEDEGEVKWQSIGLTMTGYFKVGKRFFLGMIYRPSLLQTVPTTKLKYEHLVSLDMTWKIRLEN